jgi:hypothetical protein
VISAFYYLRVVVVMFMQPGEPVARQDPWLNMTAGFSAVAIVALSLAPGPLLQLAAQAVIRLFLTIFKCENRACFYGAVFYFNLLAQSPCIRESPLVE